MFGATLRCTKCKQYVPDRCVCKAERKMVEDFAFWNTPSDKRFEMANLAEKLTGGDAEKLALLKQFAEWVSSERESEAAYNNTDFS